MSAAATVIILVATASSRRAMTTAAVTAVLCQGQLSLKISCQLCVLLFTSSQPVIGPHCQEEEQLAGCGHQHARQLPAKQQLYVSLSALVRYTSNSSSNYNSGNISRDGNSSKPAAAMMAAAAPLSSKGGRFLSTYMAAVVISPAAAALCQITFSCDVNAEQQEQFLSASALCAIVPKSVKAQQHCCALQSTFWELSPRTQ